MKKTITFCFILFSYFQINSPLFGQTVCQTIGQDSALLYSNGYVVGPENLIPNQVIHTDSKWISVTGAETLNITTLQHRLYDSSRIYNQNNQLIWQWNGEDTGSPTWYTHNHSVNISGNSSIRIEFYQGYNGFCNGYMKITSMICSVMANNDFNNVEAMFSIYPNPTKSKITINCIDQSNLIGSQVKITNLLGQEIYNSTLMEQISEIPLSSIASKGMYFTSIIDNSGKVITTKKIILE